MSWWNRRKPESIWCDLEGLGQLIDDINTDVGMSEMVSGPGIRVRPGHYASCLSGGQPQLR